MPDHLGTLVKVHFFLKPESAKWVVDIFWCRHHPYMTNNSRGLSLISSRRDPWFSCGMSLSTNYNTYLVHNLLMILDHMVRHTPTIHHQLFAYNLHWHVHSLKFYSTQPQLHRGAPWTRSFYIGYKPSLSSHLTLKQSFNNKIEWNEAFFVPRAFPKYNSTAQGPCLDAICHLPDLYPKAEMTENIIVRVLRLPENVEENFCITQLKVTSRKYNYYE